MHPPHTISLLFRDDFAMQRQSSYPHPPKTCRVGKVGLGKRLSAPFLPSECDAVTSGVETWDWQRAADISARWAEVSDGAQYTSSLLKAEVFLRKAITATEHLDCPNPLRTAVCFCVLSHLASQTTPQQSLLKLVYREMLLAVYSLPGFRDDRTLHSSIDWHLSLMLWHEQFRSTRASFLKFRGVAEQGNRILARQQMVLGKAIKTWQGLLMRRYLCAWNFTTKRLRRQRAMVVRNQYLRRCHTTLRRRFDAWRSHSAAEALQSSAALHHEAEANLKDVILDLKAKNTQLSDALHKLQQEKTCLDEELVRVQTVLTAEKQNHATTAAALKDSEETTEILKRTVADACEMMCPPSTASPTSLLEPLAEAADIYHCDSDLPAAEQRRIQRKNHQIHSNRDALNKQAATLKTTPPERVPALRFLLLCFNRTIFESNPSADLVANLTTDLRDMSPFASLLGGPASFSAEPPEEVRALRKALAAELNDVRRAERCLERLATEYFPDERSGLNVTPLNLTENGIDANFMFIQELIERIFLPRVRLPEHASALGKTLRDQANGITTSQDAEEVRNAFVKMHASGLEWKAYFKSGHTLTTSILRSRLASKESSVFQDDTKKRERDPFIQIDARRLEDLFEHAGIPEAQRSAERATLLEVLTQHCADLYGIWKFYTPDGRLMSCDKFWRFVSNIRVIGKNLKKGQISRFFNRANSLSDEIQTATPTTNSDDEAPVEVAETYNPNDELTATEWVDIIIHIAYYRAKGDGMAARLEELLEVLKATSCQSNVDEFRDHLYQKDVQQVLTRHNLQLQKIFRHFSKGDSTKGAKPSAAGSDSDMSLSEFKQLLKEAKLLDATFTVESTAELFKFLQENEDGGGGGGGGGGGKDSNQTLIYREFLEVVVCVAIYKYPAPYIKLADRLQSFMTDKLLPNLAASLPKLKIKVK